MIAEQGGELPESPVSPEAAAGVDAVERMLADSAALVAEVAGACAVLVLATDGRQPNRETWHTRVAVSGLRARMRRLGAEALRGSPGPARGRSRVRMLVTEDGPVGAVVLEFARVPGPNRARDARTEHAIRVLTRTIEWQRQLRAQRLAAEQQERWFRQLDQQVRVLDRERQKLAAVVNQSDTHVFVTDLEGRIRWANRTLSLHASAADGEGSWVGRRCSDVCSRFSSGASLCVQCPVTRALQCNDVAHQEFRETVDGRVRTLYLSALPITDVAGHPQEALVLMQDLSDLETLRESEERYRVVTQAASDGIVTIDEDGRIIFANDAIQRIFGYRVVELIGQPLTKLMPPEFVDGHRAGFARYLATGRKGMTWEGIHLPARHQDGREIIIEMSFGEYVKEGKRLFTGVMRDITDRRIAELELKRAQEQLEVVVSNSPIVLFAIDANGRFTLSEGRGLELLGLEPGQVVGQSAFETYAGTPAVVESLRRALGGEEFTTVVEFGSLAFETCYTPMRDEKGDITGVIGLATDVTERRELEQQLRHAQKMEAVGRLAAGVAHDFNNRLTTILGYSSLLLQRESGKPAHGLVEIKHAAERAAELTRQLLAFSRRQVVEPHVIDLNYAVAQAEEMLGRLIGENVQLTFAPATDPAWVRADLGQLEQVLMNLVVNARDAMPGGGEIHIEIANGQLAEPLEQGDVVLQPGPCTTLQVRDSGCGMDDLTMARAFEPFFTSKPFGQGTGLGLSIVYGIVQQSGWHVAVQSRPDAGSCFVITLPRAAQPVQSVDAAGASDPGAGTETVLLVEDEDPVRALAHEMLTSQGYRVLEAASGADALALAARHPGAIDLLVTDVVMPGMDGGELVHHLTTARPHLRVLYISGYSDDALMREGVSEADCAFLQKPFTCEAFVVKVRAVLDAPQPRRAAA
jgi:PAS domain S-box-containing protein